MKRHTKSNPKSSAPLFHIKSLCYKSLRSCQGYLRVQLYLFCGYSGIRTIWGNRAKSCTGTRKKLSRVFSFTLHINWGLTKLSRWSEGWVIPVSGYLGFYGNFRKLGRSALIFLELYNLIILTYRALNLLSRMGPISSFGQVAQEILLNNYLKTNFENLEIRDFVPTF